MILCVNVESMSMDSDVTEGSNKHIDEATGMLFCTVYVIKSARLCKCFRYLNTYTKFGVSLLFYLPFYLL